MKTIIYVMGVPCSGKSTLLKQWAAQGGVTIPEFFEKVPSAVHHSGQGSLQQQKEAQAWVLHQHRLKELRIQELTDPGIILVERSPLDLVVYGKALDELAASHHPATAGESIAQWTERQVATMDWTPGIFVLLQANIDSIRQRWFAQRNITADEWHSYWEPFTKALQRGYDILLQQRYTKNSKAVISIVNSDVSIEETFCQFISHMQDPVCNVTSFLAPGC